MNYINLLKIAKNALLRNKFRAFLTMLGIIIGVASVIAMLAIGQGSKKSIQDQMSSMGSNLVFIMPGSQQRGGIQMGNSSSQSLKLTDVEAIRQQCPDITAVSPEVRTSGQSVFGNSNWPTSIFGGNIQYFGIKKIEVESGRIFTDQEISGLAKVCLIGKTVVKNIFPNGTDPIGQTIRFKNIPMKIIGVLGAKGENSFGQDQDDLLIAPYTTVQRRFLAIDYITGIYTSAISEEKTQDAINELQTVMRKQHKITKPTDDDFRVMSQSELGENIYLHQRYPDHPFGSHCRNIPIGWRHRDHEYHVCFGYGKNT